VDIVKGNMGWIEVVVGPMFSGKSEELIRRLRRAEMRGSACRSSSRRLMRGMRRTKSCHTRD